MASSLKSLVFLTYTPGLEVKCPTPTPTFPNFQHRLQLFNKTWMYFGCQQFVATSNQWKSRYRARILCFNKSFKRNCKISTGIPDLGVQRKNDSIGHWSRSSTKNPTPTPTPSVLRNPTPSKNLRLLAIPTPTPQLCCTGRFKLLSASKMSTKCANASWNLSDVNGRRSRFPWASRNSVSSALLHTRRLIHYR